jgi:type IV pilus biogenesis/stability protein PilW
MEARTMRKGDLAGWLVLIGLVLALGGCATPQTVGDDASGPSKARARRDLGVDYLSTHKTAMAIRELRASLEEDASDPVTHLWLGEAYRRKGQTEEARQAFETAAKFAADRKDIQTEQDARLNLSAILSQMGRYEEALPHCEALSVDPTFASPWRPLTNCGWALIHLGRYDEARQHLVQALDYFPSYGPALLDLGILETKQGHSLAAVTALKKAIASSRLSGAGRAEANFRLGEIFVSLGDREKAIAHFRAAVETGPMLEWGSQSQAYLDLLH